MVNTHIDTYDGNVYKHDMKKIPMTFRLDAELMVRVDAWIKSKDASPSKTTVVEAAICEFLDNREEPQ